MNLVYKDFIECLKNNPNHAYDYITDNAWAMSKDNLTDICKELIYAVISYGTVEKKEILGDVAEELTDLWEEE